MYQKLKTTLRKNVSQKWLHKNELWLRAVYTHYFVAKGDCRCPICGQALKKFTAIEKGELICPNCGSGKRHRRLFLLLVKRLKTDSSGIVLDFSPNNGFAHYARKRWNNQYQTTNFEAEDNTDFHYDITQIDAPDQQFATILCYHVLEHIPEDVKAMRELYRILKPGGCCYIQTPFKEGDIYENPAIITPEARLKHFEQEDHVRIYSVNGLADRLKAAGFKTEIRHYRKEKRPEETKKYGFKDEEFIILAEKTE